jgi:hypothetical protein
MTKDTEPAPGYEQFGECPVSIQEGARRAILRNGAK